MKYLRALLVSIVAFGASLPAAAGTGAGTSAIEHVGLFNNGEVRQLVFFYTSTRGTVASCNTYRKRWVLDISQPIGKAMYAYLLASIAAGKEVSVAGTGACELWGDSETAQWIGQPLTFTGSTSDIPIF